MTLGRAMEDLKMFKRLQLLTSLETTIIVYETLAKGNLIRLECKRSEYIYLVSHNFIFHFFAWYTMVTNST